MKQTMLVACPAASAAQVHDWLKEHHSPSPKTSPKTVYNFVMAIRQKHNIPLEKAFRDYFIVDQLAYGLQAQADPIAIGFGQYHLRNSEHGRKKVHFFIMMLSRSRLKYIHFLDKPFTIPAAIDAHEAAFKYFGGMTTEVVYDQDRLFLVAENMGELLLTQEFKDYIVIPQKVCKACYTRLLHKKCIKSLPAICKIIKNAADLCMLSNKKQSFQIGLFNGLADQPDQKHPLYLLANKINWSFFEDAFKKNGCPCQAYPPDGIAADNKIFAQPE